MPELRWTLLIIGIVFIAALAWWERRRPHQASRENADSRASVSDPAWSGDSDSVGTKGPREPTLTLPDVRVRESPTARELPVLEITDDLPIVAVRGEELSAPAPVLISQQERKTHRSLSENEAGEEDVQGAGHVAASAFGPESASIDEPGSVANDGPESVSLDEPESESVDEVESISVDEPESASVDEIESISVDESEATYTEEFESGDYPSMSERVDVSPRLGAASQAQPAPPSSSTPHAEPIVDWPAEQDRKLLALRLVAAQPDRLPGRALRQALAAEGFVLGKYGIFHKPDAQNRAVLSAASLTKPGSFDLETMDTQRFAGLNLFAVLPGPKPPLRAFDELLVTARTLNERLEGALQDERGGPLTPTRVAALREALESETK